MAIHPTSATAEAYLDTPALRASHERQRTTARSAVLEHPWFAVAAMTAIGLVARIIQVRGIWVDEAISVHQAHMSVPALLANLRQTDNHPPLYFLTLWATSRLLGYSTLAVRTPSIIAGTLLIPAMFITGRELFDRRTGLLAALLVAVGPLMIWYSQEARPYEMFALFATLAVWAQVRVIRTGWTRYWVAWAALTIALLYTHYFSTIPIALQQLAFAAVVWHRARRGQPIRQLLVPYWIMWIAIAVAVAPLAPFVHQQFSHDQTAGTGFAAPSAGAATSQSGGAKPNVYGLITNFVWAIWGYHADSTMLRIAALWPLLMLLGLAMLGRGRGPTSVLVVVLAVIPPLVLMVAGVKKTSLFDVRYFSGAVPMMILVCARGIMSLSGRKLPIVLATVAVAGTLIAGSADQQLDKNNPRDYDFRSALQAVNRQIRPGDTLVYAPNYLQDVIEYYSPRVRAEAAGAGRLPLHGRVFFLASFLGEPGIAGQAGATKDQLIQARGKPVSTKKLEQIYLWTFRR